MTPDQRVAYETARALVQKEHPYKYKGYGTGVLEAECGCGAEFGPGEALIITDTTKAHVEVRAEAAGQAALVQLAKEAA